MTIHENTTAQRGHFPNLRCGHVPVDGEVFSTSYNREHVTCPACIAQHSATKALAAAGQLTVPQAADLVANAVAEFGLAEPTPGTAQTATCVCGLTVTVDRPDLADLNDPDHAPVTSCPICSRQLLDWTPAR